jgi:DNA-binding MarR family transcriptional regulator
MPMLNNADVDRKIDMLQYMISALVRREGPDLTSPQLGVFLICYLSDGKQTVRGLAAKLRVSKPAISRVLDRLSQLRLARRQTDPSDRRGTMVARTPKGQALMLELRNLMLDFADQAEVKQTDDAITNDADAPPAGHRLEIMAYAELGEHV